MKTFQILSFLLAILTVSCTISSIEDFVVGENFIKDNSAVVMLDTVSIRTSVVKFDSIYSNSSGRLLWGSNYNSYSGYKSSNAYFEMKFDDDITETEFVYDSLVMILNYDTYYSGDTTVTQTLSVHRISEKMNLDKDNNLYTTDYFSYDETPLGSINLKPRPKSHKNEVRIKLSDKLGAVLAQKIKDKNDSITSSSLFVEFFHGLVLKSQNDAKGAVIGFSVHNKSESTGTSSTSSSTSSTSSASMPEIRLYYHLSPNPNDLRDQYYKFSFYTDGIYFNQISGNSTNTLIDGISDTKDEKSTKLTDNKMLVQSGIQVFSKFKFPYLLNLKLVGENSGFIAATLRLYPVKGTYNKAASLPDSLYVYSADRKNVLTSQILLPGSSSDYALGRLTIDKDADGLACYDIDITSFINSELKQLSETDHSLFIGYGSTKTKKTVEQVILYGANSGKYAPKMNVYYYHH